MVMGRLILLAMTFCVCIVPPMSAQNGDVVRVMYWNMTGGEGGSARQVAIERVIDAVSPDIVIVHSSSDDNDTGAIVRAFAKLVDSSYQRSLYSSSSRLLVLIDRSVGHSVRVLHYNRPRGEQFGFEVQLEPEGCLGLLVGNWLPQEEAQIELPHDESGVDLRIMAQSLEDVSACEGRIVVIGSFYAASSNDPGLQKLSSGVTLSSPIMDVADVEGVWDSTAMFGYLHTESSTMGLVARTSMALVSASLLGAVRGSGVYGNDGEHFGRSVADGVNKAVSAEIADYLAVVSPALPVVINVERSVSSVQGGEMVDSLDLD